ncbi:hypothetical protein O7627_30500 [Solwaraspora sp. WMMD1047]|uniref:hypothetical protein n=1 Tax=Solwaraspora sp. WMMD1047 TaxID=3016102 RepID=UPI002415AD05|nr:hypothetical protein [Solwaraspora sp. WMMD1047]MDG4833607.1 hypothetical protein [Solwaraspora sp. WMMD1047]
MIYTKRSRWVGRSAWWWGAGTVVGAAALGVLLSATLVACGGRPGQSGNPDRLAEAPTASAVPAGTGLGGAEPSPGGTPDAPAGGDGAAGGDPQGGAGDPADPPSSPPEVEPSAEDCVSYDPADLTVEAVGDAWRMRSGSHLMKVFDTKVDAEDGVKVARNWTLMCFIGRGNDRADRHRYIFTYWRQPSGLPLGPAPALDCVHYDPTELRIHGPDGSGWGLRAGGGVPLLFLDTAPDAERARLVAAGHRQLCVIGHGNDRPDPARYLMQHWRG